MTTQPIGDLVKHNLVNISNVPILIAQDEQARPRPCLEQARRGTGDGRAPQDPQQSKGQASEGPDVHHGRHALVQQAV